MGGEVGREVDGVVKACASLEVEEEGIERVAEPGSYCSGRMFLLGGC